MSISISITGLLSSGEYQQAKAAAEVSQSIESHHTNFYMESIDRRLQE